MRYRSVTPDLTVGEIMSGPVHTVLATDAIRDVHSTMRMSRIRHMPVLDDKQQLLGIVSDRDLFLGWSRGPETPVSEVMTRHLQAIGPTHLARDAAARMLHDKIGCLPVLDDKRRLVGIVTDTDFVELAHLALTPATEDGS
jgi:CBS domain-containing protein